jgi:hypothetical protein
VDCRVSGAFSDCVVELLLVEDGDAEGDDADQEHDEEGHHERHLDERLPSGRLGVPGH